MIKGILAVLVLLATFAIALKTTEPKQLGLPFLDQGGLSQNITSTSSKNNGIFFDLFSGPGILNEAGDMDSSDSADWWLNSGGMLYFSNGTAHTIKGNLEEENKWRILYAKNNSRDTDNGYHPQNIFRLVTRDKWANFQQEGYFKITETQLSGSRFRNSSNGLLFFNRYQDGDNLYYTGVRVDGYAVIKKKIHGKYFTMAYERVYPGEYDRKKNPNLLPINEWMGVRSEVKTEADGSVLIKVFLDRNKSGNWDLVAEAVDDGKRYGDQAIIDTGYAGIRTDFMDVEFDNYRIEELK